MSGTWWTRVFVIIVTLLWGVWMVTPRSLESRLRRCSRLRLQPHPVMVRMLPSR